MNRIRWNVGVLTAVVLITLATTACEYEAQVDADQGASRSKIAELKLSEEGATPIYNEVTVDDPVLDQWTQDFRFRVQGQQALSVSASMSLATLGCAMDSVSVDFSWVELGDDGRELQTIPWPSLIEKFEPKPETPYALRVQISNIKNCMGLSLGFAVLSAKKVSPPSNVLPIPGAPDKYLGEGTLSPGYSHSLSDYDFKARSLVKDFKLAKGRKRTLYFASFMTSSSCINPVSKQLDWVELDRDGNVVKVSRVSESSDLEVKAETAYVLRVTALDVEDCYSVSLSFGVDQI